MYLMFLCVCYVTPSLPILRATFFLLLDMFFRKPQILLLDELMSENVDFSSARVILHSSLVTLEFVPFVSACIFTRGS